VTCVRCALQQHITLLNNHVRGLFVLWAYMAWEMLYLEHVPIHELLELHGYGLDNIDDADESDSILKNHHNHHIH
jgi:hypothetical protein